MRGLFEKRFALRRLPLLAEQPAQLQAGVKVRRHHFGHPPVSGEGTLRVMVRLAKIRQPFIKVFIRRRARQRGGEVLARALGGAGLRLELAELQFFCLQLPGPLGIVELRA